MKEIALSKGYFAKVDDDLFDELSAYKWHVVTGKSSLYAACYVSGKRVYMHRLITGCPVNMQVDHISGDKLDNQRKNLRICTASENQRNKKIQVNNTTGHKGVTKFKKWFIAQIKHNGKRIYLGIFSTPEEASKAYKDASQRLHGSFSNAGGKER